MCVCVFVCMYVYTQKQLINKLIGFIVTIILTGMYMDKKSVNKVNEMHNLDNSVLVWSNDIDTSKSLK